MHNSLFERRPRKRSNQMIYNKFRFTVFNIISFFFVFLFQNVHIPQKTLHQTLPCAQHKIIHIHVRIEHIIMYVPCDVNLSLTSWNNSNCIPSIWKKITIIFTAACLPNKGICYVAQQTEYIWESFVIMWFGIINSKTKRMTLTLGSVRLWST